MINAPSKQQNNGMAINVYPHPTNIQNSRILEKPVVPKLVLAYSGHLISYQRCDAGK